MLAAAEDLPNRRRVWKTLSEIFLDTDASNDRERRVHSLVISPYSVKELEHILIDEVYPILKYNLISVAGVWDGFDQAWLENRIFKRLGSPFRRLFGITLGRLIVPRLFEWQATKAAVAAARNNRRSAPSVDAS